MIVALMSVVTVGALIAAPSRTAGIKMPEPPPRIAPAEKPATPIAEPRAVAESKTAIEPKTPPAPQASAVNSAARPAAVTTAAVKAPLEPTVRIENELASRPVAEPASTTSAIHTSAAASHTAASTVTIAGCLEADGGGFRLKDTEGADAPKSRSWKSGFLRRRPAPISVVNADDAVSLAAYVGQRVSATGSLVNGEMRARSLHSMSSSCR